jgi:hypothetical protein
MVDPGLSLRSNRWAEISNAFGVNPLKQSGLVARNTPVL